MLLRRTGCDVLIMHGIHRDARLDAERGRAPATFVTSAAAEPGRETAFFSPE